MSQLMHIIIGFTISFVIGDMYMYLFTFERENKFWENFIRKYF